VRQWLHNAAEDLGVAEHLLLQNAPYRNAVGFHAQQAAEKYLKTFLVEHQIEFPKTHDLGELLELVATQDAGLAAALGEVIRLTDYAVEVRYPGHAQDLTPEEAREAVRLAKKVRDAVEAALPHDG